MDSLVRPFTVIIPAHNEVAVIGRLLESLAGLTSDPDVEIIVACNGCTDGTSDIVAQFPKVCLVEIPESSKRLAMQAADARASHDVRAYLDADVVVTGDDVRALVAALHRPIIAVAPERRVELNSSTWAVRWYYDVWQRLPAVVDGVFGRGLIVLDPEAVDRVRALPTVMSDDLAISEAFRGDERRVVPGTSVVIEAPRSVQDLLRRRIRVATGNHQLDRMGLRSNAAQTSVRDLCRIAVSSPKLCAKVVTFCAFTVFAKVGARQRIRRGDFTTWLRDDSSRAA